MSEFKPFITADGSVGLYNDDFGDIYHSAEGALSEAYNKFIYPINFAKLLEHEQIKILDICYGIGYNSKSFLNFIFENIYQKKFLNKIKPCKKYIETIHTDNILSAEHENLRHNNNIYTETIYTDNIFKKIYIKALDNDKILLNLSPFIKTGIKNINFDKIPHELKKYYKNYNLKPKINNLINFLFFSKICEKYPGIFNDLSLIEILEDKKYHQFLDPVIRGVFRSYNNKMSKSLFGSSLLLNLHNIYYRYISARYKNALKRYNLQDIIFEPIINDARISIKNDTNLYNLIFLDAFTPSKCPCLWSYDFFKKLYNLLDNDGMLLTYSSSAPVRNAMLEAGFYIGNNFNKQLNKNIGTIAVKNANLIKYPLSEFDFGLLKTRAGIFYRDENLTASNESIIAARELEVKTSIKMTSTQYIKKYKS